MLGTTAARQDPHGSPRHQPSLRPTANRSGQLTFGSAALCHPLVEEIVVAPRCPDLPLRQKDSMPRHQRYHRHELFSAQMCGSPSPLKRINAQTYQKILSTCAFVRPDIQISNSAHEIQRPDIEHITNITCSAQVFGSPTSSKSQHSIKKSPDMIIRVLQTSLENFSARHSNAYVGGG